jgi:hypothetical protein
MQMIGWVRVLCLHAVGYIFICLVVMAQARLCCRLAWQLMLVCLYHLTRSSQEMAKPLDDYLARYRFDCVYLYAGLTLID